MKHLNAEQTKDSSHFKDKETGAELEVQERMPLLEWLANTYKKFGCQLEFVTNKSQEGSQYCRGFGGVGGILRYQVGGLAAGLQGCRAAAVGAGAARRPGCSTSRALGWRCLGRQPGRLGAGALGAAHACARRRPLSRTQVNTAELDEPDSQDGNDDLWSDDF